MIAAVIGSVPLAELCLVALGIFLMPWCAGGDSARSVFRRSVRNVYWTTTALLPLTIVWTAVLLLVENQPEWLKSRFDILPLAMLAAVTGGTIFLLLRALLAGASRYAGPPDGPAFHPREPHCDDCGYLIVGLPLTSPCPECGLAVGESLPGGRRRPTDWQHSELSSAGFRDLLATQWRVLWEPAFFKRLPVQNGLRAARHFWWGTFMLVTLAGLVVVQLLVWTTADSERQAEAFPLLATWFILLPIAAQMLVMFAACLWSQFAYELRDYRVCATVCCYASPLMWPAIVTLYLGVIVLWHAAATRWGETIVQFLDFELPRGAVLLLGLAGVLLLCGWFWWSRLLRALQDVRYANA